ncbi:MAG: hypothetical protein ABH848_04045 [Candidatus Omnitrophota bacterium]
MKNWIINNFWIKIISLILAVITWFYVNGELVKESRLSADFYKSSYIKHLENAPAQEVPKMNKGYLMEKK